MAKTFGKNAWKPNLEVSIWIYMGGQEMHGTWGTKIKEPCELLECDDIAILYVPDGWSLNRLINTLVVYWYCIISTYFMTETTERFQFKMFFAETNFNLCRSNIIRTLHEAKIQIYTFFSEDRRIGQ